MIKNKITNKEAKEIFHKLLNGSLVLAPGFFKGLGEPEQKTTLEVEFESEENKLDLPKLLTMMSSSDDPTNLFSNPIDCAVRFPRIDGGEGEGKSVFATQEAEKFVMYLRTNRRMQTSRVMCLPQMSEHSILTQLALDRIRFQFELNKYDTQKHVLINSDYDRTKIIDFLIECRKDRDKLKTELKETKAKMNLFKEQKNKIIRKFSKELKKLGEG